MKSKLLLVDANVIIVLSRLGLWEHLLGSYEVHVSEAIMREAFFWRDAEGETHVIDMEAYRRRLQVHDILASQLTAFRAELKGEMLERMDAGEAELLCVLTQSLETFHICSGDSITYRYLGAVQRSGQAISLEEILISTGRSDGKIVLDHQFTTAFKNENTRRGFALGFTGQATR